MRGSRMAGDVKAGRLYSDGACFDPIDADLAEAESEIVAAAGELRAPVGCCPPATRLPGSLRRILPLRRTCCRPRATPSGRCAISPRRIR